MAVGLHEAAIVAPHAASVFELMGFTAWAVTDDSEANVARLTRLGPGDVLIAVGFRRAHPLTVLFTEKAAAQGAATVVLTDNSLSELADKGAITLFADIDSTFFAHSLVGPLSLVGALAAGVYAKDRDTVRRPHPPGARAQRPVGLSCGECAARSAGEGRRRLVGRPVVEAPLQEASGINSKVGR